MGGGEAEDFSTVEAAMPEAEKEKVHGLGFTRVVKSTEGGANQGGGSEVSQADDGKKSNKQDESSIETKDSNLANDVYGSQQACSDINFDGGKSTDLESTGEDVYPKTNQPIQDAQIAHKNNDLASCVVKSIENTHKIEEIHDFLHSATTYIVSGSFIDTDGKLASGDQEKNSRGAGTSDSSTIEEPFIVPQLRTNSRAEDPSTMVASEHREQISRNEEASSMLLGPAIQENNTTHEVARRNLTVPHVNEQIITRTMNSSKNSGTEFHEQVFPPLGTRSIKSDSLSKEQGSPGAGTSSTMSDPRPEEHVTPSEEVSSIQTTSVAQGQDTPSAGTSNTMLASTLEEHSTLGEEVSSIEPALVPQEQDSPGAETSSTMAASGLDDHVTPSEEVSSIQTTSVAQGQDIPSAGTRKMSDSRVENQISTRSGTSTAESVAKGQEQITQGREALHGDMPSESHEQITSTAEVPSFEEISNSAEIRLIHDGKKELAAELPHLPESVVFNPALLAPSEGPALQHERKDPTEPAPCSQHCHVPENVSVLSEITKPATSSEPSNPLPETEVPFLPSVLGKVDEFVNPSEALDTLPESNIPISSGPRSGDTQPSKSRDYSATHVKDFKQAVFTENTKISSLENKIIALENEISMLKNETIHKLEWTCDELKSEIKMLKNKNQTSTSRLKESTERGKLQENEIRYLEQERRELQREISQLLQENVGLKKQLSLSKLQRADELFTPGSYLDDTIAATPALFVTALNGVKDASTNFCKVLKTCPQNPRFNAVLQERIGAVSRPGHIKFQHQAFVCSILFEHFEHESFRSSHARVSKPVQSPKSCFQQYQMHDVRKNSNIVQRVLQNDPQMHESLHEFCIGRFLEFVNEAEIKDSLSESQVKSIHDRQHLQGSNLYSSFCKLAVLVWLLHRLAFSFKQPARKYIVDRGVSLDLARMCPVVPLDDPSSDEELQGLKVGFYVIPGFDIGNSTIPCEVYAKSR